MLLRQKAAGRRIFSGSCRPKTSTSAMMMMLPSSFRRSTSSLLFAISSNLSNAPSARCFSTTPSLLRPQKSDSPAAAPPSAKAKGKAKKKKSVVGSKSNSSLKKKVSALKKKLLRQSAETATSEIAVDDSAKAGRAPGAGHASRGPASPYDMPDDAVVTEISNLGSAAAASTSTSADAVEKVLGSDVKKIGNGGSASWYVVERARPPSEVLREEPPPTIVVSFGPNDLRVTDNYALSLAVAHAKRHSGGVPHAVVAVLCLDERTFAQPSLLGGFYRQSPQRARFFLSNVAALRKKLLHDLQIPLVLRVGKPEEVVPRLAKQLNASMVVQTTQYAPHEQHVHDAITAAVRKGLRVRADRAYFADASHAAVDPGEEPDDHAHGPATLVPVVCHSVWQSTLVHVDDLPTAVPHMKEGIRWYIDDVSAAQIRPTRPFTVTSDRTDGLPVTYHLLPGGADFDFCGELPTLADLGYADQVPLISEEQTGDVVFEGGEAAAEERVREWLSLGGLSTLVRPGRKARHAQQMYKHNQSRVSPWLSVGAMSPRNVYEIAREVAYDKCMDGDALLQFRELVLRLARRDFCHFMGVKYGRSLFFPYGPRPDHTDDIPDWRRDERIVQRWCGGLTGIPFADAAMKELTATGFCPVEGRKGLAWLLTRGYGQDWRYAAEWFERCSLDYDPFICWQQTAYHSELIRDDFGENVYTIHHIANRHDAKGIYTKRWLPLLWHIPTLYIHRPHVMTEKMQLMHGVQLGRTYPLPIKLWDGAQHELGASQLPVYFSRPDQQGGLGLNEGRNHTNWAAPLQLREVYPALQHDGDGDGDGGAAADDGKGGGQGVGEDKTTKLSEV